MILFKNDLFFSSCSSVIFYNVNAIWLVEAFHAQLVYRTSLEMSFPTCMKHSALGYMSGFRHPLQQKCIFLMSYPLRVNHTLRCQVHTSYNLRGGFTHNQMAAGRLLPVRWMHLGGCAAAWLPTHTLLCAHARHVFRAPFAGWHRIDMAGAGGWRGGRRADTH